MWGKAIYFAEDAKYSHSYSFSSGTERKMFFARVLVGNTKFMKPDNNLNLPPSIDGSKRYDSVSGHTNGSNVFMIYVNKKAYPEFLITYKQ